jgi:hypothetical protein
MRTRDLVFPLVMCFLTLATVYRYAIVRDFISDSREYSFVVEADGDKLPRIKADLRGVTFQDVEEERIEDGLYRITLRCPPDKVGLMWSFLSRRADN